MSIQSYDVELSLTFLLFLLILGRFYPNKQGEEIVQVLVMRRRLPRFRNTLSSPDGNHSVQKYMKIPQT